jgi:hypothetical protein
MDTNSGFIVSQGNPESVPCFDVDEIYGECYPVYLNVNIHFFTNTNCIGDVQRTGGNQREAFALAELIVKDANQKASLNPEQWPRQTPPVIVCNPIRYYLKGAYMHCQSGVNIANIYTLQTLYGINTNTEINMYIAEYVGNSTGVANDVPGTFGGMETLYNSDFNHEIGHMLGLDHANGNLPTYDDGCPDTNPITHEWDRNCDMILTATEQNRLCFVYIGDPGNTEDKNNNGTWDCAETTPCTPSPCCSWSFQNNNNMLSAGGYQESFSECQVKKMLTNLATDKCDFIVPVGSTPPPNAFITQTPEDILKSDYCSEYLVLSPSYNDVKYILTISRVDAGSLTQVYSTGWRNEPAKDFRFTTANLAYGEVLLVPSTNYKAVLTVKNDIGVEDTAEYFLKAQIQTPAK